MAEKVKVTNMHDHNYNNFWANYFNPQIESNEQIQINTELDLSQPITLNRKEFTKLYSMHSSLEFTPHGIIVTAEVPGFSIEDITAIFEDKYLRIKAENKGDYSHKNFIDSWDLFSEPIDVNNISAKLNKGILTITLPVVKAQPKTRTIPITE